MQVLLLILLTIFGGFANGAVQGGYVGCFPKTSDSRKMRLNKLQECFEFCESTYHRYAAITDYCICKNTLLSDLPIESCDVICPENPTLTCGGFEAASYYDTGVNLPGPVIDLQIEDTSDTGITITWRPPDTGSVLGSYQVKAMPIKTYSSTPLSTLSWNVQKELRKFELLNLHPATKYNISIISKSGYDIGGTSSLIYETNVGIPDPQPDPPQIYEKSGNTIKVELKPVINNNGPVSSYRVVVHFVENELVQNFKEELLKNYREALEDGLQYYIAAELDIQDKAQNFTVGDSRSYGNYYNAPITTNRHVHLAVGVVSRLNNVVKVRYSNMSHNHLEDESALLFPDEIEEKGDTLIVFLTVACIIAGILLLGSVIVYGYIRIKLGKRTTRLERHEMSMQGPILEVDNNGYIADSAGGGINFNEQLQQILYNMDDDQKIVRRNLSLDIENILGIGNFGDIIQGKLSSENLSCQIHVISDDMEKPSQLQFLRELNHLLQYGYHKNLQNFLGICQTNDWFYVVFEDVPMTLKKFMLNQRLEANFNNRRLTNMTEEFVLKLVYDLCETMDYLSYNKIIHKNLNSFNIKITKQNHLKVQLFGPTLYCNTEEELRGRQIDDERWFSPEVMKFQNYTTKSDVWSFAVVCWEIVTLGATPYGSIITNDLLSRIKKGLRPDQASFIYDDFYQLLLNCWELDANERPTFNEVLTSIKQLQTCPSYALNYEISDSNVANKLPYYMPLLEIKN